MMHESGSSFLAFGSFGKLKAWALGTDKPILDTGLNTLGPSCMLSGMRFAASRDLSIVATCYADLKRDVFGVSVWR